MITGFWRQAFSHLENADAGSIEAQLLQTIKTAALSGPTVGKDDAVAEIEKVLDGSAPTLAASSAFDSKTPC